MQYEELIPEIVRLECPVGMIFTAQGAVHRDNGGGIIVHVEDEKTHIIFGHAANDKWDAVIIASVVRIVSVFEALVGVAVYDPQLGRTINIPADLSDIETSWNKWEES